MDASKDLGPGADRTPGMDDYDERAVESSQELEDLVRLRGEISWSEWKAHPRFKKERMIREAQRRFGVVLARGGVHAGAAPANDVEDPAGCVGELGSDEAFTAVCDARRDGWMDAMDGEDTAAVDPRRAGGMDDE